jgi:ubiquinol-cytochrome c reductase core subunit 2
MDTGAAISSVGFIVKTGSRNETNDNRGVNHALRLAAGLGTADNTSFSIVRSIQQAGGNMDVVSSREYTLYSSQVPRNNVRDVVDYLMGTVDSPVFKRWEVNDIVGRRMSADVANLSLAVVASELLHKAAFREGLGNSLYAPEYMVM